MLLFETHSITCLQNLNCSLLYQVPSISRNIQSCTSCSNRLFVQLPKVKALRSLLSDLGASCSLDDCGLVGYPPSEGLDKNSRQWGIFVQGWVRNDASRCQCDTRCKVQTWCQYNECSASSPPGWCHQIIYFQLGGSSSVPNYKQLRCQSIFKYLLQQAKGSQ